MNRVPAVAATDESEVSAVALIRADGAVLLQLRDNKPGLSAAGLWVFPGGHADPNEDPLTCAYREFAEETGYTCTELRWLATVRDAFLRSTATTFHLFWDRYDGHSPYECREGQALAFVERERAPALAMPAYTLPLWDLVLLAAGLRPPLTRAVPAVNDLHTLKSNP